MLLPFCNLRLTVGTRCWYHVHVMLRVAYHTLGCKVNQYETEKTREALEGAGFETVGFHSRADVYIINTCSVTGVADGKSRAAIRRALRTNPEAYVVVAGCYAELEPAQVSAMEGVDLVVPNSEKDGIAERIIARFGGQGAASRAVARPRSRTRAVVKVQDGCDQFCAYCVIPYARVGKTSWPMAEVLDELRSLAGFGYKEIVLTGIRLGSYEDGSSRLPELTLAAAEVDGIERVRLSSVEPWEVDDSLLAAMTHPKVCRHLHIPLQSGDDRTLARMDRPYTTAEFAGIMSRVRERIPGVGITTDIIVGFPGETAVEFAGTLDFARDAAFSRLHVFRYSPRDRTRAAAMPDQVDSETKKARAERLIEVGSEAVRGFARSSVGERLMVLAEREVVSAPAGPASAASHRSNRTALGPFGTGFGSKPPKQQTEVEAKHLTGFADNYVEVVFAGDASLRGEIVPVRVTSVDDNGRAVGYAE